MDESHLQRHDTHDADVPRDRNKRRDHKIGRHLTCDAAVPADRREQSRRERRSEFRKGDSGDVYNMTNVDDTTIETDDTIEAPESPTRAPLLKGESKSSKAAPPKHRHS